MATKLNVTYVAEGSNGEINEFPSSKFYRDIRHGDD